MISTAEKTCRQTSVPCTWRNPSDARESPASFSPLSAMTCSRKALIPCISSQTTPHFTSAMAGSFCAPYRPKSQTPSLFPSECTPAKHLCRGPFSPRKRKYKLLSSFSPRKRESMPSATSLPGNGCKFPVTSREPETYTRSRSSRSSCHLLPSSLSLRTCLFSSSTDSNFRSGRRKDSSFTSIFFP